MNLELIKEINESCGELNNKHKFTNFYKKAHMPIPNQTFFGLDTKREKVTFGNIRQLLKDETKHNDLVDILRLRIDRILNDPTQKVKLNRDPYLLTSLTCQGIEILGQIFHPSNNLKSEPFRQVANKLHQQFSRNLKKDFKQKLKLMWSDNNKSEKIDTLSELLYKFLRNDLTHMFVAKGVYLSYTETKTFKPIETEYEAYLIINPDWYFETYRNLFNEYFF
jgi:hypothetical protein